MTTVTATTSTTASKASASKGNAPTSSVAVQQTAKPEDVATVAKVVFEMKQTNKEQAIKKDIITPISSGAFGVVDLSYVVLQCISALAPASIAASSVLGWMVFIVGILVGGIAIYDGSKNIKNSVELFQKKEYVDGLIAFAIGSSKIVCGLLIIGAAILVQFFATTTLATFIASNPWLLAILCLIPLFLMCAQMAKKDIAALRGLPFKLECNNLIKLLQEVQNLETKIASSQAHAKSTQTANQNSQTTAQPDLKTLQDNLDAKKRELAIEIAKWFSVILGHEILQNQKSAEELQQEILKKAQNNLATFFIKRAEEITDETNVDIAIDAGLLIPKMFELMKYTEQNSTAPIPLPQDLNQTIGSLKTLRKDLRIWKAAIITRTIILLLTTVTALATIGCVKIKEDIIEKAITASLGLFTSVANIPNSVLDSFSKTLRDNPVTGAPVSEGAVRIKLQSPPVVV